VQKEHPFAQYVRILGKGRNGARALTRGEARTAMEMISRYDVLPEQLGAFLMLMRVKEESPEEVAGMAEALLDSLPPRRSSPVAIDWPAYAGKRRQLPWFVLAALILGRNGHPVFMHGACRTDERLYVSEAMHALGIELAYSLSEAADQMAGQGFAFMRVQQLSRLLDDLIETRLVLGLRSPLHTVARMLNPFDAPVTLVGVFHPNFAAIHQQASALLGMPRFLAAKGEGGEFERVPDREVTLYAQEGGRLWVEEWPALVPTGRFLRSDTLDLNHFRRVWEGEVDDQYAELAVTGTLAMALRALGKAEGPDQALAIARRWWQGRHEKIENVQQTAVESA